MTCIHTYIHINTYKQYIRPDIRMRVSIFKCVCFLNSAESFSLHILYVYKCQGFKASRH